MLILRVLNAANTKWNFQKYVPGLVGGHCIGVDPYYLTYKAKEIGHNTKLILAGRKLIIICTNTYLTKLKLKSVEGKILLNMKRFFIGTFI